MRSAAIGTSLDQWKTDCPDDLNRDQIDELRTMKFFTVEMLAMASDMHIQRIGMGGTGLREKARRYLRNKASEAGNFQIEEMQRQIAELTKMLSSKTDAPAIRAEKSVAPSPAFKRKNVL